MEEVPSSNPLLGYENLGFSFCFYNCSKECFRGLASLYSNQLPLQLTMKGFTESMNSGVFIPSLRSTSPPPSQKKSGLSFVIASSKITWQNHVMKCCYSSRHIILIASLQRPYAIRIKMQYNFHWTQSYYHQADSSLSKIHESYDNLVTSHPVVIANFRSWSLVFLRKFSTFLFSKDTVQHHPCGLLIINKGS